MFDFNSLLVPVDFSPASRKAFVNALETVTGEKPLVIVLHVVDPSLAEFAAREGLGRRDDVLHSMRARAEEELRSFRAEPGSGVDVETIVSEGIPFVEIVRKAEDFKVNAIVIAVPRGQGAIEDVLFGSTAERVIRTSPRPVLVLPIPA